MNRPRVQLGCLLCVLILGSAWSPAVARQADKPSVIRARPPAPKPAATVITPTPAPTPAPSPAPAPIETPPAPPPTSAAEFPPLSPRPSQPLSTAPRVDACPGERVALMLTSEALGKGRVRVKLDDGIDLHATLFRVSFGMSDQGAADPWMGVPLEWSAQRVESVAAEPASYLLVFTLPEQARGQGIWINQERRDVQWLPRPEAIVGEDSSAWTPTLPPGGSGNPGLTQRLREAAQSPLSRWRVRLLLDGMRSPIPPVRFEDPAIEAWAAGVEELWRTAFARVWREDHDVCDRLKRRVSAVVDFGGGVFVPAWPTDESSLQRLRTDLLQPGVRPGEVARRAEQFLAEQPQGVVWVVDDGGVLSGSDRRPLPMVGVANFTGRDALAFGYLGDEPARPDLFPIRSFAADVLTVSGDPAQPQEIAARATIHLSRWTTSVPVAVEPVPVTPPGLRIGPFLSDMTMEHWLYGRSPDPVAQGSTTALLHRPAPGADGVRHWELFVECRRQPSSQTAGQDRVCICIGPPGLPDGLICVNENGEVTASLANAPSAVGPHRAIPVESTPDRWVFRLPLPRGAVEKGDLVRLGIIRRDTSGRRSAWPRPLLPWQEFPSRALVDLSAWTGFEAPGR